MEKLAIELLSNLIKIKAVNPRSQPASAGELPRTLFIQSELKKMIPTIIIDDYHIFDKETNLLRPNFVATLKGKNPTLNLYIICHLDTVPEGDLTLWDSDPFMPRYHQGKLYGRGAEDNLQDLVSIILAMKQIYDAGIQTNYNISLVGVCDEETGSHFGLYHLLKQNIFKPEDLIIVPDYGTPEGNFIEVAEKGILWFKVEIIGKQAHASRPDEGLNAHLKGLDFNFKLYEALHSHFNATNPLFEPQISTFQPTKKDINVDNINTLPGKDIVYFDCRVLPEYPLVKITDFINEFATDYARSNNLKIDIETIQLEEAPPPTNPHSPVVTRLRDSIAQVLQPERVIIGGIGGGTCGGILRKAGLNVVVWAITNHTAHQANENSEIANLLKEVRVYHHLLTNL